MPEGLPQQWPLFIAVVLMALATSLHAVVNKRNSYSAFAWLGVIALSPLSSVLMYLAFGWFGVLILAPLLGSLFYIFLGVNQLRRKYRRSKFREVRKRFNFLEYSERHQLLGSQAKWQGITITGNNLGYSPKHFCAAQLLNGGDEAYPEMLNAISKACQSITLFSYIFANDECGKAFVSSLIDAKKRGVSVRVLIDAVGSSRSQLWLLPTLRRAGIKAERFMPVLLKSQFSNLRNHRKLLVIDGCIAFTGGLNIASTYWPSIKPKGAVNDLHFKIEGMLVNYLQDVFINDWLFSCGEVLSGSPWFNEKLEVKGENIGRVIVDGPSFEEERLQWHFLNAINLAEKSVKIVTPYFLPNQPLESAICAAAVRGISVEIITAAKPDHAFMNWALKGNLHELLARGCKVYLAGPNFDHSKFLLVDNDYMSIGSANWDARSLRLNYELNIELIGSPLGEQLAESFDYKKRHSKRYTLNDLNSRPSWQKLRDGFARLFTPYL